ncbi:MAG: hypothetical protein ACTHN5_02735 [Phycisphaerae bacterium]
MPLPRHSRSPVQSFVFCVLCFAFSPAAHSETHLLSFGGGPSPDYNQVSLEKNIQFLQHTLEDLHLSTLPHDIFFADGGSPYHIVKYLAPPDPAPNPAHDLTAEVADIANNADIDERYQPVSLKNLAGPATHDALTTWFSAAAKSLHTGDHLLFYFTGHGGDESPRNAALHNTTMEMWDSPPVTVRQFITELDKLDPAVDVTLIMVQCHAGGFANVLYTDGDPKKGLCQSPRCGFFATTAPRLAAGCTPEMNEDDYQDFSTHFFAALAGHTRTGKPVTKPDYDHKGFTSFTDAFTYALLNDDTIDIPLTTSDQLLRDFSHYRTRDETTDLLENNAPYSAILAAATPAQRAAIEGLSEKLKLTGEPRMPQAANLARDLVSQRNALTRQRRRFNTEQNAARSRLHNALLRRYPELGIPHHPTAPAILAKDHDAIQKFLDNARDFKTWRDDNQKLADLDDQDDQLERKWVLTQRFLDRCRTVILANNLPKVAPPDIVAAYTALLAREARTLSK